MLNRWENGEGWLAKAGPGCEMFACPEQIAGGYPKGT